LGISCTNTTKVGRDAGGSLNVDDVAREECAGGLIAKRSHGDVQVLVFVVVFFFLRKCIKYGYCTSVILFFLFFLVGRIPVGVLKGRTAFDEISMEKDRFVAILVWKKRKILLTKLSFPHNEYVLWIAL
jgi:hypothetical protein